MSATAQIGVREAASPVVRKLRHGAPLTEDDVALLSPLLETAFRAERGDILREGAEPRSIMLVLDGWAYRYKQLENGLRQITAVYVPGDLCEPFGALPRVLDHTLAAATPVVLARVSPVAIHAAVQASPRIEAALWWDLLFADAIARQHMISLGRRSAIERLAYFFCEVHARLWMVGLVERSSFAIPLTQADLADLFGLSTVHVNRSLQELRRTGLLSLRNRRVTISDVRGLRELAMFDLPFLRLDGIAWPGTNDE